MTVDKGRDVIIMVNGKPLTGVQRGSAVTLPYEDMEQEVAALVPARLSIPPQRSCKGVHLAVHVSPVLAYNSRLRCL